MKNISYSHGKYRVIKYFDDTYHDYGSYPTKEIAIYVRDMLQENDWKIPFQSTTIFELDEVFHVLHNLTLDNRSKSNLEYVGCAGTMEEAERLAGNPLGEKYINSMKKGYNISKTINNKRVSFGYFKEHQVAYDMRDYLISCEWMLPTHNDEYMIHINDKNYLIRVQNGKIKLVSSDDLQNIYKTKQGYSISRLVNKKRYNYKTYNTIEEAKSMRRFLREHNWDKELFMKEYSKRYPSLPEHIYYHNGKYQVKRKWKGMTKQYGQYFTLAEAVSRVKYLEEHDWESNQNISIVNYDGVFYIMKRINYHVSTPLRKFYYANESRDKAEEMLERFKNDGFPEPYLVTNKYRYIVRNRQVYYVMYHRRKLCYARSLSEALVARDICELLGWCVLDVGDYGFDGVVYRVVLNAWGTPVFGRV